MSYRRNKTISGILLAAAVLGFFAIRHTSRGKAARDDLIAEIRRFEGFATHGTLLIDTIEANHGKVRARNLVRRSTGGLRGGTVTVLDRDGYRNEMYRMMVQALSDAGEAEAAAKLEKFRARGGR